MGKGRGAKYTKPIYEKLAKEGKSFVNSYRVFSDDEGETWSRPVDITKMVGRQAHFGASEGRQLTSGEYKGRLLLPGSRMDLDEQGVILKKHVGVWSSDDHGVTWKLNKIPVPKEIDTPRNVSSEARVTELKSGVVLYNERTRNTGRQVSRSKDYGTTWDVVTKEEELKASQCNGSLLTLRDGEGRLTDILLLSVPSPGGRSNGVIYISKDGGKTWPIVKNMVRGKFAYSALVQLNGGKVGLFYETGHYRVISFLELEVEKLMGN